MYNHIARLINYYYYGINDINPNINSNTNTNNTININNATNDITNDINKFISFSKFEYDIKYFNDCLLEITDNHVKINKENITVDELCNILKSSFDLDDKLISSLKKDKDIKYLSSFKYIRIINKLCKCYLTIENTLVTKSIRNFCISLPIDNINYYNYFNLIKHYKSSNNKKFIKFMLILNKSLPKELIEMLL